MRDAMRTVSESSTSEERIGLIKKTLADQISAADSRAVPKTTEYFNHTFAPDLVIRWPYENRERLIYIRDFAHPSALGDSIDLIKQSGPIVLSLNDIPEGETGASQAREEIAQRTRVSGVWITDIDGIDTVRQVREETGVSNALLSQALLRGGEGITTAARISQLAAATSEGVLGAAHLNIETTTESLAALGSNLNSEQAGHITRVMRAIWEGHGGSASRFPASESIGKLTDDDLNYLLETIDHETTELWGRIGPTISTEQLARLRVDGYSRNLQQLVRAGLETLNTKAIQVNYEQPLLDEPPENPRWIVDRQCLALRFNDLTVFVAARSVDELPTTNPITAPKLAELRRRVRHVRSVVKTVQFRRSNSDRAITYLSEEGLSVLNDPDLQKWEDSAPDTTVDQVQISPEGGGTATLEYARAIASGQTNSRFVLGPFLRSTLPLLTQLSERDLEKLDELIGSDRSGWLPEDPE